MLCTIQLNSLSGSFGSPSGTDVIQCPSLSAACDELQKWADEHNRVGSEPADAHALLWRGHHADVTDLYPDLELTLGPRRGVRRQPC